MEAAGWVCDCHLCNPNSNLDRRLKTIQEWRDHKVLEYRPPVPGEVETADINVTAPAFEVPGGSEAMAEPGKPVVKNQPPRSEYTAELDSLFEEAWNETQKNANSQGDSSSPVEGENG